MSQKIKYDHRANVRRKLAVGASQVADSVILISEMPVYLVEGSDANNDALCVLPGTLVAELTVDGQNNVGAAAVAIGDKLYKDGTEINVDSINGVLIGYALETVNSGATTAIDVLLFVN